MRWQGTTTAQLRATPDGGIYVVATEGMVRYCRELLHHIGRKPRAMTFITISNLKALEGRRGPITVDHAVSDWVWQSRDSRSAIGMAMIQQIARAFPGEVQ